METLPSLPPPVPARVPQEGCFWKANNIITVALFSLVGSLWSLNALLLEQGGQPAALEMRLALLGILLAVYLGHWLLIILPSLAARCLHREPFGGGVSWLLAFGGLLLVMVAAALLREKLHGGVLLLFFVQSAVKLAHSPYGLRSLMIPLSVGDVRVARPARPKKVCQKKVCPKKACLWRRLPRWGRACVADALAVAAAAAVVLACLKNPDCTKGYSTALSMAVLLVEGGRWLAPLLRSPWARAGAAYRADAPGKAIAYSLIGLAGSALWVGILLLPTACWQPHWRYELYEGDSLSLLSWLLLVAAVAAAQGLPVLWARCAARRAAALEKASAPVESGEAPQGAKEEGGIEAQQAREVQEEEEAQEAKEAGEAREAKNEREAKPHGGVITCWVLLALVCVIWGRGVMTMPPGNAQTEASPAPRPQRPETSQPTETLHHARPLPDVDLTPGYLEAPTPEEREAGMYLAACALQGKGEKYDALARQAPEHCRVEGSPKKYGFCADLGEKYEELYSSRGRPTALWQSLYQELPPSVQNQFREEWERLQNTVTWNSYIRHELLGRMLAALAEYRMEHPDEAPIRVPAPGRLRSEQEMLADWNDAIKLDDRDLMDELLTQGVAVDALLPMGSSDLPAMTAVQWCLYKGRVAQARELVKRGASLGRCGSELPSVWCALLGEGLDARQMREVALFLLEQGVDPNVEIPMMMDEKTRRGIVTQEYDKAKKAFSQAEDADVLFDELLATSQEELPREYSMTPLVLFTGMGEREVVERLLEHGARQGVLPAVGTPLHVAAAEGRPEMIHLLLQFGADINAQTERGWTPLMRAVGNGQEATACLLVELGADVSLTSRKGNDAVWMAVMRGQAGLVPLLLEKGGSPGKTVDSTRPGALRMAIARNDAACIRALLAGGAPLDVADEHGLTDGILLYIQSQKQPRLRGILTPAQNKKYRAAAAALRRQWEGM